MLSRYRSLFGLVRFGDASIQHEMLCLFDCCIFACLQRPLDAYYHHPAGIGAFLALDTKMFVLEDVAPSFLLPPGYAKPESPKLACFDDATRAFINEKYSFDTSLARTESDLEGTLRTSTFASFDTVGSDTTRDPGVVMLAGH